MKHTTRLICCVALCSVVSSVALAERRERPERVPSTGVLPVVQGVGSLTVSGEGYWHQYRYRMENNRGFPHTTAPGNCSRTARTNTNTWHCRTLP